MLSIHRRALALVLPLAFTALALGDNKGETGTTPLFNEKDFTGWRLAKGEVLEGKTETPDKRFSVTGGTIAVARKDKDGKGEVREITTTREFAKDFVLRLEFKAAQEAVGAVVVRNHAIPVADFTRRGEQKLKQFKNDDWNELEVTVKLAVRADGKLLTEADNLEFTYQQGKPVAKLNGKLIDPNPVVVRVEAFPRCNGELLTPGAAAVVSKGAVGLRTGNGKLEFRNIRFRELP